jgi:integrase
VKVSSKSEIWYGRYKAADGGFVKVPLCSDKTSSKQILAKLVTDAKLAQHGLGDAFESERKRPLLEHLADFEAYLRAKGTGPKHIRNSAASIRRVLDACGFVSMTDLSSFRVQTFIGELRRCGKPSGSLVSGQEWYSKAELAKVLGVKPPAVPAAVRRHRLRAVGKGKARRYPRHTAEALLVLRGRGRSIKTANLHLAAMKQFSRWLVRDRRMAEDPLVHLSGGNVQLDRRHDRRALPTEELTAILQAALASTRTFRKLTGRDRHFLYLSAMTTGYRASELAELRPDGFRLDENLPTVVLGARETKNKRTAVQPIPPDVADVLRGYLADKPAGLPVWPGSWVDNAAEMLRGDLEAAGIPYVVEGPDGPLFADFHSLRHSYVALLDRGGATLKEAMQLARHSDPKLTMARYGRAQLHDLAGAVEGLPSLLPATAPGSEVLAATGTDELTIPGSAPRPRLDQIAAIPCGSLIAHDQTLLDEPKTNPSRNSQARYDLRTIASG